MLIRLVKALAVVAMVGVLLAVGLGVYRSVPIGFDPLLWKNHEADQSLWNPRIPMGNGFAYHQTLLGKTPQHVRQLLGEPMRETDDWAEYYLGGSFFGELLVLKVKYSNHVVAYVTVQEF